ncbi:uncharacterized protein [Miscanthus floridulus]|uniref:uncharacterized protein n=1 Tax=Miscanthus floridulus TaxID=154761 RepID=UPI003457849F
MPIRDSATYYLSISDSCCLQGFRRRWLRRATRRQLRLRGLVHSAKGEGAVDSKDLQQQSKALDELTDHVEDRQLDSSRVQSVHLIRSPPPPIPSLLRLYTTVIALKNRLPSQAMAALASSKEADWKVAWKLEETQVEQNNKIDWHTVGHCYLNRVISTLVTVAILLLDAITVTSTASTVCIGEKELAAVKINPTDVEIIANELELDKKIAERTLREHKGDAVAAVRFLLH